MQIVGAIAGGLIGGFAGGELASNFTNTALRISEGGINAPDVQSRRVTTETP